MSELRQLVSDDEDGVFDVLTDDGDTYRLDLHMRTVTVRTREESATRDQEPAPRLLTVATCRIGQPMVLLIDRGAAGISFTRRTTPPVLRIRRCGTRPDPQHPKERP